MSDLPDNLRDRFLEAEKRVRREDYVPREKVEWRTVYCPKCQKKVEYFPKENFNGLVKCSCGAIVRVPSLDGFIN